MKTPNEVMYYLWKSLGWTQKQIADLFGCDVATVCRRIEPERWKRWEIVISPQKLKQLYEEKNRSVKEVAELLWCSERTIRRRLKKYGIPIRNRGRKRKADTCKKHAPLA